MTLMAKRNKFRPKARFDFVTVGCMGKHSSFIINPNVAFKAGRLLWG